MREEDSSPEAPESAKQVAQYSIEDFLGATDYRGASLSPDGSKILVYSDAAGVYNAYAIPVDGSEVVQLTASDIDSVFIESYFPNNERFVVATIERDEKFFDVYLYSREGYEREMVYQNDEGYDVETMSSDLRYAALVKQRTTNDNDLYLLDRENQELKHLTPLEGDAFYEGEAFSIDGTGLYFLSNEDSEFKYLARYDLATGETETLMQPDWDIWFAKLSKSGKYLVVGINNDARTEVQVYDTATMEMLDLTELPVGDLSQVQVSRDDSTLIFHVSSGQRPGDLFVWKIGEGAPFQLTRSLSANKRVPVPEFEATATLAQPQTTR